MHVQLQMIISTPQAELDELVSQTGAPPNPNLKPPSGPETLTNLVSEVRRHFSTGCPTSCSHPHH